MHDILQSPFMYGPLALFVCEMVAMVIFSRLKIRWALQWIVGNYLVFVVVAFGWGYLVRDEFGFSSIPLSTLTQPWLYLLPKYPAPGYEIGGLFQNVWGILFSAALNCFIFYIIGRLSYPKRNIDLSVQDAT